MIESRCGILCGTCPYNAKNGGLDGSACTGCTNMDKPVWADSCPVKSCCEGKGLAHCGLCADFPCELLVKFSNDKEHGDEGRRIEQCKKWAAAAGCCAGGKKSLSYEVVALPSLKVAGISLRTSNANPVMQADIGSMWERFFAPSVHGSIAGKASGKVIGLYTNYEGDFRGAYDFVACCEVADGAKQPQGIETRTIPAAKYAKFVVSGSMEQAVGGFWQALWKMDLPRSYTGDFEEYQEGCTMEQCEVHMYIALK